MDIFRKAGFKLGFFIGDKLPEPKPPMDTDPAKVIDSLLAEFITPVLKEQGFKKNGRTYFRQAEQWTEIINCQANKWNSREEGSFTFNLGLFHPESSYAVLGEHAPKTPHEYDCQVRHRITNDWWEFDYQTNLKELGARTQLEILGPGLEFFERFHSLDDLLRIAEGPIGTKAALAFYAGNKKLAQQELEKQGKKQPYMYREAFDEAMRLGLPFDAPKNEEKVTLRLMSTPGTPDRTQQKLAERIYTRLWSKVGWDGDTYLYTLAKRGGAYEIDLYTPDPQALIKTISSTVNYARKQFTDAQVITSSQA